MAPNLSGPTEQLAATSVILSELVKLLEKHEYDPNCKFCCENKFVKQAHKAKEALPNMVAEVTELRQQSIALLQQIDELDVDKLNDYIQKSFLSIKTTHVSMIANIKT